MISYANAHSALMDDLIGDLLCRIAFTLLRYQEGYTQWCAPEMAPVRQMLRSFGCTARGPKCNGFSAN